MRFEKYITKDKLNKILSSRDWKFDIAMLVTEARYFVGFTQTQLANKMKTKQSSIARVESGKMLPSLDFLDKLAKAIGTNLVAPRFAFMLNRNTDTKIIPSFIQPIDLATANISVDAGINREVKLN